MTPCAFKKGNDPILDEAFLSSKPFAKIRLGKSDIFFKKGIRWFYVPICELDRIFHRIEEAKSHVGCCSTDFSVHKLVMVMKDGDIVEALIGDSLYRHEDEALMKAFSEQNPEIPIKV